MIYRYDNDHRCSLSKVNERKHTFQKIDTWYNLIGYYKFSFLNSKKTCLKLTAMHYSNEIMEEQYAVFLTKKIIVSDNSSLSETNEKDMNKIMIYGDLEFVLN